MGYDTDRFENSEQIDKDLYCPICADILQDPVCFPQCEHSFCRECITRSLEIMKECPVDRNYCEPEDLKPIGRFKKKYLTILRSVLYVLFCTQGLLKTA